MRIVAGKHRGLTLEEFDADNIRPTTDRVRENIFNKIQFDIAGSSVLDLFCGTGAVSLEFLSRNADRVVSVDNNPNSVKVIEKNFAKAKEKLNLLKCDFKDAIKQLSTNKFDFIFLDPPYDSDFGEQAIDFILKNNMLKKDGLIIFEHIDKKHLLIDTDLFIITRSKKYGEKNSGLFETNRC